MILTLIISNILVVAIFLLNINRLPPELPLFYSRSTGEAQIAPWWMLFVLPLIMNGLVILNGYLARRVFKESPFISMSFRVFTIAAIVSLTLVFLKIILLIT
ncbi:hypothetical protein HYS00_04315 [Candidatus Microgenomates bacterium]|nr:hypothetical protein [Candidatus Microgenomates bacterium]